MEEQLSENRSTFFENEAVQFIIRLLTAISFALFTLYQFILLFALDVSKIGRLMGIVCFLMITVAAFLTLSKYDLLLNLCSILLVVGLFLVFFIKLLNIPALFGILSFDNPPAVLNCAVFILSEAGAVILAVFYLTLRNARETVAKRKAVVVLMSVVIVMYVVCLIMECVMLIIYRINIDLSMKVTLISRFVYCLGFVGLAGGLMLPAPMLEGDEEYKDKQGDFIYSEDDDDEIDLVL